MGKEEDVTVKDTSLETTTPSAEKRPVLAEAKEEEKKEEIRKVIKLGEQDKDKAPSKPEIKNEAPKPGSKEVDLESTSRDALEQKRAILQSIKDFDFQIKKNQEDITSLNQKLDSVTKDLDDLVSLYEIVSEQMNPFVGLSKVTKKRLDALENFTKEIEELKTRVVDMESFAERTGSDFEAIKNQKIENKASSKRDEKASELSGDDLDKIIEKSFSAINIDQKIDDAIDEFIENLKSGNIN